MSLEDLPRCAILSQTNLRRDVTVVMYLNAATIYMLIFLPRMPSRLINLRFLFVSVFFGSSSYLLDPTHWV